MAGITYGTWKENHISPHDYELHMLYIDALRG